MNCPSCGKTFSYLYTFKIRNPLRHDCPACGKTLTVRQWGSIAFVAGAVGFAIAAVALAMEHYEYWTMESSLVWFLVSAPVAIFGINYLGWKKLNFAVLDRAAKKPSWLAAVAKWAFILVAAVAGLLLLLPDE